VKLIKNIIKKFVVLFAVISLMAGCGKSADNNQSVASNTTNSTENVSDTVEGEQRETSDLQKETDTVITPSADATVTPEAETDSELDEPVWIEDELYELAVNELGADK
jgi:hypothetical protein